MITKLYNLLKENIKFFITLVLIFLIFTFELPYYIDAPGGLLNVEDRVFVEDSYEVSGSLNLAYVKELKATIPTIIYSYFNKDWDILKKEEIVADNETIKENEYRSKVLLEESIDNATIVGFSKAKLNTIIESRRIYVTYVDSNAMTDLKIGDQIISMNNVEIKSKEDIYNVIKEFDTFNIEVINDNKRYIRKATKNNNIIGITISETKDVITDKKIEFNFKDSESGPSGGFMMALSIYNYLTEEDITKGLKIVGTGTIDEAGNVGAIGGVGYKLKAAVKNKADLFFVPSDNYKEALNVKNENNLNINLISISNIDDAIDYLKNI